MIWSRIDVADGKEQGGQSENTRHSGLRGSQVIVFGDGFSISVGVHQQG